MHTDASMFVFWNTLYCYAQMEKVETQNFASHKEKRHLFLSVFIASVYCYGLIGRRKILRLYWACAVIVIDCLLLHPSSALLQSVWFPIIPM